MRWLHIGMKDLTITLRDSAALGILFGMPLVLIFILGSALGNIDSAIGRIPVAIVNLDEGRIGKQVTDGFFTDETLRELFASRRMRSPVEARRAVERGDLVAALVIGSDFSRRVDAGKPLRIVVLTDPGREITSSVFRSVTSSLSTRISAASIAARTTAFYVAPLAAERPGLVAGAIGRAVRSASSSETLEVVSLKETDAALGDEIRNLDYYAGSMSVMFLMFGSMFGAFSMVREREHWTLARLMTTPANRTDILAGKAFGVFCVALVQWAVLFSATSLLFGVRWGDALSVWVVALGTAAAATGMAVFVAAVGRTVRAASGIAQVLIQSMAAIGGSFFPVSIMPTWLQPLHFFSVNGWAIDGMLAGMRGGPVWLVAPNVLALLAIAGGFLVLGVWRLKWE